MPLSPTSVDRVDLTVEVVQADDRQGLVAVAALDDIEQDLALAVLGLGNSEHERQRRREVDRARGDLALGDAGAAGQERGPHVDVGRKVLDVRHVAVLTEEVGWRDQGSRRLGVVLIRRRGEDDEVAGSGGMGHVGGRPGPVRDVARLRLGEDAVDDLPALGLAVMRPVVGIGQGQVSRLDLERSGVGRGLRGVARVGHEVRVVGAIGQLGVPGVGGPRVRVPAVDIEVDLEGATGPARLRLGEVRGDPHVDRRRSRKCDAAVRDLRHARHRAEVEQPEVEERLARVDRQELRGEAVVRGHERGRIARDERPGERQDLVGLLVRRPDVGLARGHAAVGDAVEIDIVVRRVGGTVAELRADEAEELVLELVGRRHPDEEEVRLVLGGDVLEHRHVAGGPVQALLDVGVFARDAGLEDREVGGRRGRELLGEVLLEVAGEAGLAGPRRPGRERARDGGVEQAHARQVARQLLDLDEEAGGLAVERVRGRRRRRRRDVEDDLDVGPLALGEGADDVRRSAAARPREEDLVVVGRAVVRAVEDVGVQAVLVDRGTAVEHPKAHLLGRAERRGNVRPRAGRNDRGLGHGGLAGSRIAVRMIELEPERRDERRVVEQRLTGAADEVRRDATAREEALEVNGRAVDRRVPATGPLDLGDLEAGPLGGLGDRLRLEDVGIERRGPGGPERVAVLVERVVGRGMDPRPGAGRERVPAGARVRRSLGQEAVAGRRRPVLEEGRHRRHHSLRGVPGDDVLAHAVGSEEDGLAGRRLALAGWRGGRCRCRHQRQHQGCQDHEHDGPDADAGRHGALLLENGGHWGSGDARTAGAICGRRSTPPLEPTSALWTAHDTAGSESRHPASTPGERHVAWARRRRREKAVRWGNGAAACGDKPQ